MSRVPAIASFLKRSRTSIAGALLVLLLAAVSPAAHAADADGFRPALPGYSYEFPRDHGSHPGFRTEWWYFTGHLRTDAGRRYGFEVTFFRVGVRPPGVAQRTGWDLEDLSLAHFALTDLHRREFRYYEKLNRSSPYTAFQTAGSMNVFNEGWRVSATPDGSIRLVASERGDSVDLVLRSLKPPAVHGVDGVSVKAAGRGYASHYYSLSRLEVSGAITSKGKPESCTGKAWMDHEFGSAMLRDHQQGWDWFSVQLDNEIEVMIYQLRKTDGKPDVTSAGSIINSDGSVIHLRAGDFTVTPAGKWKSKASGALYPMGWTISIPPLRVSLRLTEELQQQELITRGSTGITYWEGAVKASGTFSGTPVSGQGYVEMTGYDRKFGR